MMMNRKLTISFHEDHDYFREAVNFSAAKTEFPASLIEKDYFCTLLLDYLSSVDQDLVFKGGTCLAKIHADFYRLSEDLDFSISMPINSTRTQRRNRVKQLKVEINQVNNAIPAIMVTQPMKGANNSSQYIAAVEYPSVVSEEPGRIKVEVGLREPLLKATLRAKAKSILLDPVQEKRMVPEVAVTCLSLEEAMAEKCRAALTRRQVAIRDFYDLFFARSNLGFSINRGDFIDLVRQKISMPGNDPVNMSDERLQELIRQEPAELQPVLRPADFSKFDLKGIFSDLHEFSQKL